ncbi:hypothetical protein PIB30_023217 [Stylosanthes scabra]|uniref:NAC domain-containing protein n=1 Tax=Stylosanthes scabra TaxID=79078 RepID=A0ABU6WAI7_9FABA|nr:hypothetical protein [Stylosanthes scabra]
MARSWLIDIGGIAKKVKSTNLSSADQIKDCGAYRECPNCNYRIDNRDVSVEWPGFPVGVKFDPSDVELLEHLAGKCSIGNAQLHMFINEFIPTLDEEEGICYTHPENLPGVKKDGSSVHFFHRTTNAYTTGQRKRRKIHHQSLTEEHVRWHKTGKTKAILEDGVHKGFKKIMVLYIRPKNGSKPEKTNWVMHQYHLGTDEDEKDGEYVVSKILHKQTQKNEENPAAEDFDQNEKNENQLADDSNCMACRTSPRTPKPNPPNPPRAGKVVDSDDNIEETELQFTQDVKSVPLCDVPEQNNAGDPAWLAGESQAVENFDFDGLDDILFCNEIFDSSALLGLSGTETTVDGFASSNANDMVGNNNLSNETSVLDTLDLGTPPDFDLSNLDFYSQDSIFDWVDRL